MNSFENWHNIILALKEPDHKKSKLLEFSLRNIGVRTQRGLLPWQFTEGNFKAMWKIDILSIWINFFHAYITSC